MSHRVDAVTAQAFEPFATDVSERVALPWGVWDQQRQAWIFHSHADRVAGRAETGFPEEGWLLNIGSNWTHIDADLSLDGRLSRVAELVQDAVMDETGKGWPEYAPSGVFRGLLIPRGMAGRIVWTLRDAWLCDAGDLTPMLQHRG